MTVPSLALSASPLSELEVDAVIIAATTGAKHATILDSAGLDIATQFAALGGTGAVDELVRVPGPARGPRAVAIAGVGDEADAASLRLAMGNAVRGIGTVSTVAIAVPAVSSEIAAALLEGAALGAYRFDDFRSSAKPSVTAITLITELDENEVELDRVRAIVDAVGLTRDLVNTPPAELSPERLADVAVEQGEANGIDVRVWQDAELEADGFGGIVGVGAGSSRGPRLVRMDYAPTDAKFHLALVGKGITFDSGGLSLKPSASMLGMKTDMAGAAAVLAATVALARIGVPVHVTTWLCIAENMPSGTAIRPNDVLRIKGGTTVEVTNTDAEGRLVLADGLVAASAEEPDAIIDVATLTGAQVVALGNRTSGLMGHGEIVERFQDAARAVDESVWTMPLPGELRETLKSDVADLMNAKVGSPAAGMLLAGVFLREFVGEVGGAPVQWAHLDIAGPSYNTGTAWGFNAAGATGVAVRSLVRLGEDLAR